MTGETTDSFAQLVSSGIEEQKAQFEQQQTPVTETTTQVEAPVAEVKVEAPATEAPTFSPTEWAKTEFGTEDISVIKERYTKYEDLTKQVELLSQPKEPQYKSELSKFIDNLPQGVDPKFAVQYFDVKPETLTDEQAWKLNEKLTKGYLTDEEINAKYHAKFGFDDEDLATPTEKSLKSASLKEEAHVAKQALGEFIGKTLNPVAPEVAQRESEQKVEQLSQKWASQSTVIANNLKEVSKPLPLKMFGSDEVKMIDFKYAIPAEEQKAVLDEAQRAAVAAGLEPSQETFKAVTDYANQIIWQRNGEKIAQAMVTTAISNLTEQFKSMINNPELAKTTQQMTTASKFTEVEQNVLASLGK